MANEVEIIRRAFGTPPEDPDARERARARLRDAMAQEQGVTTGAGKRRRSLLPLGWLGVAAAIAVTLLIAQTLLPTHEGGPPISAATQLRRLAYVALSSRNIRIPAGSDYYSTVTVSGLDGADALGSGSSYTYFANSTVDMWTAPDGSQTRVTTVHSATFPTEQDHNAWIAAGQPTLTGTTSEQFKSRDLSNYAISDLPTDPQKLGTLIRSGHVLLRDSSDSDVLSVVGTLLTYPASPQLRSALFQVAANLPSIQYLGSVRDPSGRAGIGVQLFDGSHIDQLIFDPTTSQLLAQVTLPAGGGPAVSSKVYAGGAIVAKPNVKP
jgi:hypothetical protein